MLRSFISLGTVQIKGCKLKYCSTINIEMDGCIKLNQFPEEIERYNKFVSLLVNYTNKIYFNILWFEIIVIVEALFLHNSYWFCLLEGRCITIILQELNLSLQWGLEPSLFEYLKNLVLSKELIMYTDHQSESLAIR